MKKILFFLGVVIALILSTSTIVVAENSVVVNPAVVVPDTTQQVVVMESKLLQLLNGDISVPAAPQFVAVERIKIIPADSVQAPVDSGEVGVSIIYPAFQQWFMTKIEEPISEFEVYSYQLLQDASDVYILPKLGTRPEVTVASIFRLIRGQSKGEEGPLLVGRLNIFYIRDNEGILRAVSLQWYHSRWNINANEIDHPLAWPVGVRVFSRAA